MKVNLKAIFFIILGAIIVSVFFNTEPNTDDNMTIFLEEQLYKETDVLPEITPLRVTPFPTNSPEPTEIPYSIMRDENFLYAIDYESYNNHESYIDCCNCDDCESCREEADLCSVGFEDMACAYISASEFVYDSNTGFIHFKYTCPQITPKSSDENDIISFYEAIIYKYNYCEECFAPIIEYYTSKEG